MRTCLINPCKPCPAVRIALVSVLTMAFSGWTTCTAIVNFNGCPGAVPKPQITSLSPDTISLDMAPVLLTANGNDFVPQSQILWNASALPTTFVDSRHLQTMITPQTLDFFGGSAGRSVLISAMSPPSAPIVGCPDGGTSATLVLVIN